MSPLGLAAVCQVNSCRQRPRGLSEKDVFEFDEQRYTKLQVRLAEPLPSYGRLEAADWLPVAATPPS